MPSQLDAASMMRIASTHSSLCCGTIDCDAGDMQISHQEPARGIWDLFITPATSPPATSPQQGYPRLANDPPWLTHLAELAKAICFGCASDVADEKLAAVQADMAPPGQVTVCLLRQDEDLYTLAKSHIFGEVVYTLVRSPQTIMEGPARSRLPTARPRSHAGARLPSVREAA